MEYLISLIVFALGVVFWVGWRTAHLKEPFGLPDGFGYFCANMAVYILTAPYLQSALGMWGLLCTEIILLLPALFMPRLARVKAREFFCLNVPSIRHVVGGIVLWYGALYVQSVGTQLIFTLFPGARDSYVNVSSFIASGGLTAAIVAGVLAPAVCEEFMHRGVILASMRGKYNDAFITVAGGFFFGLFHLDAPRFLGTAAMGMALTYAGLRSRSLLLPMLLHFINNLYSLAGTILAEPAADTAPAEILAIDFLMGQAFYCVFGICLLSVGYALLRGERRTGRKNPILLISACMAIVLAAQAVVSFFVMTA